MSSPHSISKKKVSKRKSSSLRLICFAGAGSGASYFNDWQATAAPQIEVCAIKLPGRINPSDGRYVIPFSRLITNIAELLKDFLDVPFAFFGHSLGALISFEVARNLQTHHGVSPRHLYISACRAPQVPRLRPEISHLSNRDFIDEICRNYDFPREMSENAELMQLVLPILRADFHLFEQYKYLPAAPLCCGITVFAGANDRSLSRAALCAWKAQTLSAFDLKLLGGNHFLSSEEKSELLVAITDAFLAGVRSSPRSPKQRKQSRERWDKARPGIATRGGGISKQRKLAAVMRLLRGDDLELVSRSLSVTVATLATWRDVFLAAGEAALAARLESGEARENERIKTKLGEVTVEREPVDEEAAVLEDGRPWTWQRRTS